MIEETASGSVEPRSSGAVVARLPAFVPVLPVVVSLFLLWGIANNLNDVLIGQFKKAFSLSDFQSGLVQSAFYMGYFLLAVPASLFMRRYGYKAAIVGGLLLYGSGALLFYPAAEMRTYGLFLTALFVIASGLAFLETSANPLVTMLGPPQGAARRLNFAQAFNPLGAIAGVLIGREFILSGVEHTPAALEALSVAERASFYAQEARAVQTPYLVLGCVVLAWAVLAMFARFPQSIDAADRTRSSRPARARQLLSERRFLMSVVAQFSYVGAQVGVWSYLIRYVQVEMPGTGEKTAAMYLTLSLVGFMVGRFAGTAAMGRVEPRALLQWFALTNVVLCLVAVLGGAIGLAALASTSFFMSIMFPTIFALGLKGLGPLTKVAAPYLVMAIIGGAVLTALMGRVSDLSSISVAMLVPAACFAAVFLFAIASKEHAA